MVPNTVLQTLTQAIKEKRGVAVRYSDQREVRVLEPHAIYTDERGELILDGFQTRGYSASGRPVPFWRPLRVKKIVAVSVLDENFAPRVSEGFSPARLKYRNGLIAIVDLGKPAFAYHPVNNLEMGPHLPVGVRR